MQKKQLPFYFVLLLIAAGAVINSCTKTLPEKPAPENPYDKIVYPVAPDPAAPPDPNSIVGIHKNILSVKCANPGCHDGAFEPDYRSVQSSYSTLVYHSVIKNTPDSAFKYRVLPNDTAKSWLWERLTTDDATLGRMPLYTDMLTPAELGNISAWIMGGAKDMFGNPAIRPDTRANVSWYIATDSAFNRLDTIRVGGVFYNPFILPQNSNVKLIFYVEDDITPQENLQVNQVKFSLNKNDFSAAIPLTASYFLFGTLKLWIVSINTSAFTTGTQYYFRYYVNDGQHSSATEFPSNATQDGYKTYYSLVVQ